MQSPLSEPADVVLLFYAEAERCGLEGFTFEWDRSVRRAGCCHHHTKTISLSYHYVNANLADKSDDVRDTVLHEIAHALAGPGEGHGQVWKDICVRIGARPVRCYDSQRIVMPKGKYVATCTHCQMEFSRHKKPRKELYHLKCGKDSRLTFKVA